MTGRGSDVPRVHAGQAMIETVLAVLFITFLFLAAFQVANMLSARILLDHAAARAARAKAVGFNDFMCLKSARVAMIPVAGRLVWPSEGVFDEAARVPIYLSTDNESLARGVLEYERWETTDVDVSSGGGMGSTVESHVRMYTDDFNMDGEAEIESHYPFYMNDQGL